MCDFFENCSLNNINDIDFSIDNIHRFNDYNYDVILANIDKNNILKIINRFESSSFKSILILAGLLDSDLTKVSNSLKTSCIDHIKQKEEWISSHPLILSPLMLKIRLCIRCLRRFKRGGQHFF